MSQWPELGLIAATSSYKGAWESKHLGFSSSVEEYKHGRGDWKWLVGLRQPAAMAQHQSGEGR